MKLSTVLVGTLAAFATAHVARVPQPKPALQGLEGFQTFVETIVKIPGLGAIKKIFAALQKDDTWKVDYSKKAEGIVAFSETQATTCTVAKQGWDKYKKDWKKFATAHFEDPCRGGHLSNMNTTYIDKLREIIGEGH